MARRTAAEIATGAGILVVAAGFLLYAVANTGHTGAAGYPLTADFNSIDGISIGSDVRIAGVKEGSVTAERVDPQSVQANVTMSVQNGLQLPTDTSAQVTSDGFLGGKYMALVPGGAEQMIKPGGRITITQSAVSLEELLGKFIFNVGDLAGAVQKQLNQKPAAANDATGGDGKPASAGGHELPPLGGAHDLPPLGGAHDLPPLGGGPAPDAPK